MHKHSYIYILLAFLILFIFFILYILFSKKITHTAISVAEQREDVKRMEEAKRREFATNEEIVKRIEDTNRREEAERKDWFKSIDRSFDSLKMVNDELDNKVKVYSWLDNTKDMVDKAKDIVDKAKDIVDNAKDMVATKAKADVTVDKDLARLQQHFDNLIILVTDINNNVTNANNNRANYPEVIKYFNFANEYEKNFNFNYKMINEIYNRISFNLN